MVFRCLAWFLLTATLASQSHASGLEDLSPFPQWGEAGHGVWAVQLGELSGEVRYTDLAGAPPKIERLNQLSSPAMPEQLRTASYRMSPAGKVVVRVPTKPNEKIYGFGLQFDNTMKTGQVIDLKVDHF